MDARSAKLDPTRSPYAAVERSFQLQWDESLRTEDLTPVTANLVADAATVERPPFNYPSAQAAAIEWEKTILDDVFVRLCALETSDDLAEYLRGFWTSNVTTAREAAGG